MEILNLKKQPVNSCIAVLLFFTVFFFTGPFLDVVPAEATINDLLAENTTHTSDLKVVASMSIPCDWAQQVASDLFTVTSIVSGFEDIHTYDPSPDEIISVYEADIFVIMGLEGLEPWVSSILPNIPSDVEILTLVNASGEEYMSTDPLLGSNNPHVWMDPGNAKNMTAKIYNKFVELDPANEEAYTANYNGYLGELDGLLDLIETKKSDLSGTKVVVHHPSFFYFFDLLEIERIEIIEETHGSEPSAQHMAEIIEKMKDQNVLLINQPQLEEDKVLEIARETGAKIADLTALLPAAVEGWEKETVETYVEMLEYNLWALENPHAPPAATIPAGGALIAVSAVTIAVSWKKRLK